METKSKYLMVIMIQIFVVIASLGLAAEKEFPIKPIELYCPYGAGGSTSIGARIVAGTAAEILGRPVVVINKTGAGGSIAAEYVAKAKPDGYTLLVFNSGSNGVTPAIRTVRYSNADFELYCQYTIIPLIMLVKADAPWKSLEELIAYAKQHPGELKYPTSGIGTSAHFAMELFNHAAGTKIVHLPFKSDPECTAAILGGHAHVGILWWPANKGPVEGGKLRILAQASEKRLEEFPNIPTFAEKGFPEVTLYSWYGIAGPKGIPKEISDKLRDAFSKSSQHKEVIEALAKLGFTPYYRSAEDFAKFVKDEEEKYRRIAKEDNIRLE